MGGAEENVRVAVRCRPFNKREKGRDAKCIIEMDGPNTMISDPSGEDEPKKFTFDFSYWSHSGYKEEADGRLVATDSKYATQEGVMEDVGNIVLENAYGGFNTSLFAYGQTGSGKSYSMVGYGVNKGIVPLAFDSLFKKIEANTDENVKFQVQFSMLEVYMEHVSDLLQVGKKGQNLRVREDPKKGRFFVQDLLKVPVGSYADINQQMENGTSNRTVAATQMNATSSRAHTVMTMIFDQIITDAATGKKTTRTSEINLIDLAGSERAGSTGATGQRLKEGAQINKSLSALGNVISALATGKKAPFRDSVLTKLLQNSLGGNAKTIMIAALSPADINYDETLSTLRYADRAKQIKNKAEVNESATDKMIRELKEENDRMKAMLAGGGVDLGNTAGMSEGEIAKLKKKMEADIRAQLAANENRAGAMDESAWEAKLAEMREKLEKEAASHGGGAAAKLGTHHCIANLNEDPALAGMVVHALDEGDNIVGRKTKGAAENVKVPLAGLSIDDMHAVFTVKGDTASLTQEVPDRAAKTLVNGHPLVGTVELQHQDRVLFGTNHLYVYTKPKPSKEEAAKYPDGIEYDFAQSEIMANKGFDDTSQDNLHLSAKTREQVMELLPMVSEANAISEKLNKKRSFEIAVLSGPVAGLQQGESTVMVKMKNLETNNKWMISRGSFIDRRFRMQALLRKLREDDDEEEPEEDDDDEDEGPDPFLVEADDIVIGAATCFLQSLCYLIEFEDFLNIVDYKGRSEGKLSVGIYPCNEKGELLDTDDVLEDPKELIGQSLCYKINIQSAEIKKAKYAAGLHVRFHNEHLGTEEVRTPILKGSTTAEWKYEKMFKIPVVTEEILNWFMHGNIGFFVYGYQSDDLDPSALNSSQTTAQIQGARRATMASMMNMGSDGATAVELAQLKTQVALLQGTSASHESQLTEIGAIVANWTSGKTDAEAAMGAIQEHLDKGGRKGSTSPTKGGNAKSGACVLM